MASKKKSSSKKYMIGLDIGGTKVLAGLIRPNFSVVATEKMKVEPHRGLSVFIKMVHAAIQELLIENGLTVKNLIAVGVGCPGIVDPDTGIVQVSPNLSFLKKCPLKSIIQKSLRVPVAVENDVNAGLYGEQQFGAAKNAKHVLGIFLGTGVGGALIFDGKLYRGLTRAAGEIGHTFMNLPFAAGESRPTLENMTGRLALASEAGLLILKQKAPHLFKDVGTNLRDLKSGAFARAIRAGDTEIKNLVLAKARVLGISMANAVNLLSPELIVLGGGLVEALGSLIIPEAAKTMKQYAMADLVRPVKVRAAALGDHAVMLGAAKLGFDLIQKKQK